MIDTCELSPSYIRAISPYQGGKPISELAREMDSKSRASSSSRPMRIRRIERARAPRDRAQLNELTRYPDGNGFELKQGLMRHHKVAEEQIVLGNGSNDVLELVARAFLHPGTSAVMSQHAFVVYHLATQVAARPRSKYRHANMGMT